MRKWIALALCLLCLTPALASAGGNDPFGELGLAEAFTDARWQGYDAMSTGGPHEYGPESTGTPYAAVIMQRGDSIILCVLAQEGGHWRIVLETQDAIVQRPYQMLANLFHEGEIMLYYQPGNNVTMQFIFVLSDGGWLFSEIMLHSYAETEITDYEVPKQVTHYTVTPEGLLLSYYWEDGYGYLDTPKLDTPGAGSWVFRDIPSETIPLTQPYTLDTFDIEGFPFDRYTLEKMP